MMRLGIFESTPIVEESNLLDLEDWHRAVLDLQQFLLLGRRQQGTDEAVRRLDLEVKLLFDIAVNRLLKHLALDAGINSIGMFVYSMTTGLPSTWRRRTIS